MNDKFKMAEMVEAVDPIEEMEKKFGKPWSQFTESEQMEALKVSTSLFSMQREANQAAGDTTMNSSLEETEIILESLGFQIGWMKWRTSEKYGYREKEAIWCRPDGLVVYMETYHGRQINEIILFGEIKPDFSNEHYYHNLTRVCSGGGGYGFCQSTRDLPEEQRTLEFNADCRSGLRRRIGLIPEVGTSIPVWENKDKFLWFLNYDEEQIFKDQEYYEISKRKFREGSPMLKAITKNLLT